MNPITFVKEVNREMRKVDWPSKEQTIRNTIVVLIFSATVALFLGFFDYLFGLGLNQFIL